MCDYSLEHLAKGGRTVDAKTGDHLVTSRFDSSTKGLAPVGQEGHIAVCLRHGTEVAFEQNITVRSPINGELRTFQARTATFCKINDHQPLQHHDGFLLPTGELLVQTRFLEGQRARVLQVPVVQLVIPEKKIEANEAFGLMERAYRASPTEIDSERVAERRMNIAPGSFAALRDQANRASEPRTIRFLDILDIESHDRPAGYRAPYIPEATRRRLREIVQS